MMDRLNPSFTDPERAFLRAQNIVEDEVFDGRGMSKRDREVFGREHNRSFMVGASCTAAGHRLRARPGSCIECDTRQIAFMKRHRSSGYVYVMHSRRGGLVKVGSSIAPSARANSLSTDAYGGQTDWSVVEATFCAEAGRVEFEVHDALAPYLANGVTYRNGQTSREIFRCDPVTAQEALREALRS